MDFTWSDETEQLATATFEFARGELNRDLDDRERARLLDADLWRKCADFGVLGLAVPEVYGGSGQELPTAVRALEGLGRGCRDNGLLFALGAQMWSVQVPILLFGSDDQKRYLPELVSGALVGAHAVTESEAGSDAHSLRTEATPVAGGYVLNGSKCFITSAPDAGIFVVLASIDRTQGPSALTAFLLARETPGISVGPHYEKIGLHTAPMAEVSFVDCYVPADAILGKPRGGSAVFAAAMEWERAFILAPALGTMRRQLESCRAYARTRRQFGRPIGRNESVANKLVEMQLRLETAQLLTYRTAWRKQSGRRLTYEPSQTKLHISEAWVANSLDAMQIHGGYGYMHEAGIDRDLTAALASRIYSGTSEIQRRIIAGFAGL